MADQIIRVGTLNCFEEFNYFSKLPVKCYNSIIGLSLAPKKKKKIVTEEIVQIHAILMN